MLTTSKEPLAFLSYVIADDKHEEGRITQIKELLASEVRIQTGKEFPIFQDRNHIEWGQTWKERIDEAIETVTFFIPIITPGFFFSPFCCDELKKFVEVQKSLNRNDLILPIYYVTADELEYQEQKLNNEIAKILNTHQYKDWRELRFKSLSEPIVKQSIADMAMTIKNRIKHIPNGVKKDSPTTGYSNPKNTLDEAQLENNARTETKIITVDKWGKGDFTTITEALEAAEPGSRILVNRGVYNEALVIDKPIEIVGNSDREQVIVQMESTNTITVTATMGKISNIVVLQNKGDFYAIEIRQGRIDIEDCEVRGTHSGIGITNCAEPRIRRNLITNGKGVGIEISKGANPEVKQNEITGYATGITVFDYGHGFIESNKINECADQGIKIMNYSNPIIRENEIINNTFGIVATSDGIGLIEGNNINHNSASGIFVSEGGTPVVRGNKINQNHGYGIYIYARGAGKFEVNDILNNSRGPWLIDKNLNYIQKKNNKEK